MKALAIAIWAVTLFSAAPTLAQFYRYVDANGHVRFTDNINQVPEKQRVAARSYVESPGAPVEAKAGDESADRKAPAGPPPVEMAVAAQEQRKITRLRLEKLVSGPENRG